jgi:hypothetical protein
VTDHSGTDECERCGGGECGLHPAGCIYGGFSVGYWLIADMCDLDHEVRSPRPESP